MIGISEKENDLKMNVLVTAIGSVAGEYVITKLKEMGHKVIGTDIYDHKWIAYADLPDLFFQVCPTAEEARFFKSIKALCDSEKINMIVPLTDLDVDFFNCNRKWFESKGIILCISSKEALSVLRNKYFLANKVSEVCSLVNTIPTCLLEDFISGAPEWEKKAEGMIIKPADGRSSQGFRRLTDREEVVFCAKKHDLRAYIIQPFIQGDRIVADVVRYPEDEVIVVALRKELLSTVNGCGTSVHMFSDTVLESACRELAEKLDVCGCVNFEFIKDEYGKYYLLECNPRFSAGVEFSALAGCDFVERHINCFLKKKIEDYKMPYSMYIARKWTEVVTSEIGGNNNDTKMDK